MATVLHWWYPIQATASSSSLCNQSTLFFLGHLPPSYTKTVFIPLLQGRLTFRIVLYHHVAQFFYNHFHAPMPSYHLTAFAPSLPCSTCPRSCSSRQLFNFKVRITWVLVVVLFSCLWLRLTAICWSFMSHLEFPVSCFSLAYYVLVQNLQKAAILPLDLGVSVVYCHHSVRYSTQQKRTSFFGHWQSPILSCQPVWLKDNSSSSVMVVVGPIERAAAARAWCLLIVWPFLIIASCVRR